MTATEVHHLYESFARKKIFVIGDVMLDSYLWGKVDRISPEAPVPIIACTSKESRLGGAANVALNLAAMGATPILCGIIGNDDMGTLFLKLMQDNHVSNTGIYIQKERPTTVKTRVISNNQQLLRIDEETDKPLSGEQEKLYLDFIKNFIHKCKPDAIIFQDYDKGALTPEIIKTITLLANKLEIPTLVDPKKRNFFCYDGANLFKPNFKEFCEGLKLDLKKDQFDLIYSAAKEFMAQKNINLLMLTLSEKGVLICDQKGFHHILAHSREITDVSGAGDTVISIASLCLSSGLKPQQIAAISNLAGGLVCEKAGVVPIDKKKLEAETLLLNL